METVNDAIAALRAYNSHTQAEISSAGGPAASEQTRMESGGTISPRALAKYVAAFSELGSVAAADCLPSIDALLREDDERVGDESRSANDPLEGRYLVFDSTGGFTFTDVALAAGEPRTSLSATSITLGGESSFHHLSVAQRASWLRLVTDLIGDADQVFIRQGEDPTNDLLEGLPAPTAQFRASSHTATETMVAIDPLKDLAGASLSVVRALLAKLTPADEPVNPWAALMLQRLLSEADPSGGGWPQGPLARIYDDSRTNKHVDGKPVVVSARPTLPPSIPSTAEIEAAGLQELRRLFRPFVDAFVDSLDFDQDGTLKVSAKAITDPNSIENNTVVYGHDVDDAANLLASLARNTSLTIETNPWRLTSHPRGDEPRHRVDLELDFFPGLATVGVVRHAGRRVAVRLRREQDGDR